MTMITLTQNERPVSSGFRVDVSRGQRVGRVSSEWFSRPDDERYLSLTDLYDAVRRRAERAQTRTVESRAVRVEASRDSAERLALMVPGRDEPIAPTHWSFGQLCTLVGAPSSYMRQLPAPLAGINLQHGLLSHRAELVKTLEADDDRVELRAVTGPDYGRIWDHELVAAVRKIAGNGTGDTRWKVPGVLDWNTMTHNPFVDITNDTTTLYASDRDVFLFLVDDTHPIEAGRLPDGSPDLYFRGFYCWNSEVGSKTLGIASFYLRAVCMNRNLWGVENFEEITIRHSKFAAQRFAHEAAPALTRFFESQDAAVEGILGGKIKAGDVVVVRYEGPRGGPGMQEMLYPTSYLKSKGLGKMCALITDGRFSGGSSGLSIGHISPEAAEGGLIGLVEEGDRIKIDIPARSISLVVDEATLAKRREAMLARKSEAWKPRKRSRRVSMALKAYAALTTSAARGAVRIVPE